jgi:hypothetical protein
VLMGGDEEREGNEMRAEGGSKSTHSAAVSLPAELMELGRHGPLPATARLERHERGKRAPSNQLRPRASGLVLVRSLLRTTSFFTAAE